MLHIFLFFEVKIPVLTNWNTVHELFLNCWLCRRYHLGIYYSPKNDKFQLYILSPLLLIISICLAEVIFLFVTNLQCLLEREVQPCEPSHVMYLKMIFKYDQKVEKAYI